MPSSPRKPDNPSSTPNPKSHEIPCAQEKRIRLIESATLEQRELLIRIDEKLKSDFRCIQKLANQLEQIIVGNSTPGLPTRITVLEDKCKTMEESADKAHKTIWGVLIVALGSIVTAVLAHIWPKGS